MHHQVSLGLIGMPADQLFHELTFSTWGFSLLQNPSAIGNGLYDDLCMVTGMGGSKPFFLPKHYHCLH